MRLIASVVTTALHLGSSARLTSRAFSTHMASATMDAPSFIQDVNTKYELLHRAFEEQFWGTKMALSDSKYSVDELTRTKTEMEAFLADEAKLKATRAYLEKADSLTAEQVKTLKLFERAFGCYIMESEEAKALRAKAMAIEGKLEDARNKLVLGATIGGEFVELSSVGLRNRMRVDPDEAVRKACYEGVRKIGDFVTANGFIELVCARNQMARALGYIDYYDYKVTQAEGFGKEALFSILSTLEEGTRPLMLAAREALAADKGASSLLPWNTPFAMAGDITKKLDPYFPFEKSVEQWGRSFAALGISYAGASMNLDLLDRKGKYSNGFCHWPQPAWVKADGTWQPTVTHFTSLADPAAIGSGLTGLTTLMHEAGHAAHFSNIRMPSPLFSQERAPTSVAYAELQSMFLDSLVGDAAWRCRYATNREGEPLPWSLIEEDVRAKHPYEVMALRSMLAVPYFEKALYEMPEAELSAASVQALADKVEEHIQGGLGSRPLLSVPHLLSDEASCYYHGYVLAEMAVHQTRAFFMRRDGFIVDNPKVGPTLREAYWLPGNSEPFLQLVERLTGSPLTGDAWVAMLKQDVASLLEEEKAAYEAALKSSTDEATAKKQRTAEPELDMRIKIVDGDEVIADTAVDGGFLATCAKFEAYIRNRFSKAA